MLRKVSEVTHQGNTLREGLHGDLVFTFREFADGPTTDLVATVHLTALLLEAELSCHCQIGEILDLGAKVGT